MTVAELIEELKLLPQDYVVTYQCCSDYSLLEPGEVRVGNPKDFVEHHNMPGVVRRYNKREWPGDMTPTFVNTIVFPGN